MDHFKISLQNDGALVASRRGLLVSKQKHHGTSFVHTWSPHEVDGRGGGGGVAIDKGLTGMVKIVTQRHKHQQQHQHHVAQTRFVSRRKPDSPPSNPPSKPKRKKAAPAGTAPDAAKTAGTQANHQGQGALGALGAGKMGKAKTSGAGTTATAEGVYQHGQMVLTLGTQRSDPQGDLKASRATGGPLTIPACIPGWAQVLYKDLAPQHLTRAELAMFHHYFPIVPRKMFPCEDILTYNPVRTREFFDMVVGDLAPVRCVLMCGAVWHDVLMGSSSSLAHAAHVSKACSEVNKKLDLHKQGEIDVITLECISSLALLGHYVGRYDHWTVHMQGLKYLIDSNGGVDALSPALISNIRKTDIKGAATLASTPFLPFRRHHINVSDDHLPLETRLATLSTVQSLLSACGASPAVTASMVGFANFVHVVLLARGTITGAGAGASRDENMSISDSDSDSNSNSNSNSSNGDGGVLLFDPHAFSEEWNWVQYELLTRPGPLRDESAKSARDPIPIDASKLQTESYVSNHLVELKAPVKPAKHSSPIDQALRLSALLYLKELLHDHPRNLGGYSIQLSLLSRHMRDIGTQLLLMISPPAADLMRQLQRQRQLQRLRPVLIWICLVADAVCRIADRNEHREEGQRRYDRSAYGMVARLLVVVGGEDEDGDGEDGGVDGVDGLAESEFVLCRMLDIGAIAGQIEWGRGWDDRERLRMLVMSS